MTIVATGIHDVVLDAGEPCDPTPYLRERKARKYLGLQDALAVVAAGRAIERAGLAGRLPGARTGLYLAVGYIPFLEKDVLPVLEGSLDAEGRFSLPRFAADGYTRAHPLLAFRCLPNMPAYHVAASFAIEGPYMVVYPSAGELYLALEEAAYALEAGDVDVALVLGVAHQRNFLVEHHMGRVEPPVPAGALRDVAAAVVLETRASASGRGARALAELAEIRVAYAPFDPVRETPRASERCSAAEGGAGLELGPAAPLVALSRALAAGRSEVVHEVEGRDGIRARGVWRAP